MNRVAQLQNWYLSNCDGDWEHHYGVNIQSLDNPGWWVKIDLTNTGLESKAFTVRSEHPSEDNWLDCKIVNQVFEGAGDAAKLDIILGVFLDWVKNV